MKNYSLRTVVLVLLISICRTAVAQDIHFSQFYDLPMLRNPALAGIFNGNVRVTTAYRNQWQSLTVPYRTMALGLEIKKQVGRNSDDFISFGLQATHDQAGDARLSRTQVFPVLNYHKSLSGDKSSYLSAGFMAGPVMQQFDPTKLSFDDQYQNGAYSSSNPTRQTFTNTRLTYWDPAVGLSFSSTAGESTNYYIGVGLFHFTKPVVSFQPQQNISLLPKYAFNAGVASRTSDVSTLVVYADYFRQGSSQMVQGGLMIRRDLNSTEDEPSTAISAGMFYRLNEALIPVVKLDYRSTSIGVTYDISMSKMAAAALHRGGFELTLIYKGGKKYNPDTDAVRCPRFF